MSGGPQHVRSLLDIDDNTPIASNNTHYAQHAQSSHPAASHHDIPRSLPDGGTHDDIISQIKQNLGSRDQRPEDHMINPKYEQQPIPIVSSTVDQTSYPTYDTSAGEYSQPQGYHNGAAKEALAPIAGPPVHDGATTTTSTAPTLTDKARITAANAAASVQASLSNTTASVQTSLSNTTASVQASLSNTTASAKNSVMANPSVERTSEQLRQELSPDSHELARKDYGVHGAVQQNNGIRYNNGVKDIGWHRPTREIPDPLIGGLPNGELFSMIRRFNKDVFDVRAVPKQKIQGLDLNEAWSDAHSTDKLPLHLQRAYLSIVLTLTSFAKQVARLRSWRESRRTGAFLAVYAIAWIFDLLMPMFLGLLIALVSSKDARNYLFPPVPLALTNLSTGGIQKPQAGQLGTTNTITGAPEKEEGEAKEEEAANFVDNIRHLVGRAMGMHEQEKSEEGALEKHLPNSLKKGMKAIQAAGSAPGHSGDTKDQTQKPMEEILWDKANPETIEPIIKAAPHYVGEVIDNWERFANALEPTPPFNALAYLRIDAVLIPALLGSLLINYYMVYKGIGFAIGFGIFGDPILTPSLQWLNRNYPNWMEVLEPKNNILRGVPTNAQLTLTLLRIGEANNTPIPPVPTSKPSDPDRVTYINSDDIPLDATDQEIRSAVHPDGAMQKSIPQQDENDNEEGEPKHKRLSKIMQVLKGNTKVAVDTKLAIDQVRAKTGNEKAKGHLGVIPQKKNLVYAGPEEYKARYDGKKGWVYVTPHEVLFCRGEQGDQANAVIRIGHGEIIGLRRATAFSMKAAEIAADWGEQDELLGSVEIVVGEGDHEKVHRFTALPERDELFNRLVAIGRQKWENV